MSAVVSRRSEARESVAEVVRRRVLGSRNRLWRIEDFDGLGSSEAINSELRRLLRHGELERVRRGVYWRGTKSRFGMSVSRDSEVLRRLVGPREAIGAAEWYATKLLGLSTQVSAVEVLSLTRRPPAGLRHVRVVSRSSRTGRRDQKLNAIEVTLLEALEGWDRYVEVDAAEAIAHFAELLEHDSIRVERLVAASKTESAMVRERLRGVLLRTGRIDQATRIERARSDSARRRALAVMGHSSSRV
jgi:Family of unknown function (DUF6088)